MTLTQILQKIRSAFYTKAEIDSMGGGSSLSSTLNSKANDSDVVHKSGDETISGNKTFNGNLVANNGKDGAFSITAICYTIVAVLIHGKERLDFQHLNMG